MYIVYYMQNEVIWMFHKEVAKTWRSSFCQSSS